MAGLIAACGLAACWLLLPMSLPAQSGDLEQPGVPATAEEPLLGPPTPSNPTLTGDDLAALTEELRRLKADLEDATRDRQLLERRIQELEIAKMAHEEATRSIIRQTFSEVGARINDFVTLGGTFEVLSGWEEDFDRRSEQVHRLDTAELDLEIDVDEFVLGKIVFEYADGRDVLLPTTEGDETAVDRFNVDTATLTIGDTKRMWPFASVGRTIVPFGISTGDPVADVLTVEDPLTIEVFETKEDAVFFGIEFPTPPLAPEMWVPAPPPVRPVAIYPLMRKLGRVLGYKPLPARPPVPSFTPIVSAPPPLMAGFYLFNGDTFEGHSHHYGATLSYRVRGTCGVSALCPWAFSLHADWTRTVFDSRFLGFEYRRYLRQIGFVQGLAASARASVGRVAAVGEWNAAIETAKFVDDLGARIQKRPRAWQVSLGYQFGWNPGIESIGSQGTYLAFGYSESEDLEGVRRIFEEELDRIGFVSQRRFLASAGEWVLDGFRFAIEYSHSVDFPRREGGTGQSADAIFTLFTYEW
jgi:hypothetical protein